MCTPTFKASHTQNSTHVNTAIDVTEDSSHDSPPSVTTVSSRAVHSKVGTLYAIYETAVVSSDQKAVVFCDDGADCTFISKAGVKKLKARQVSKTTIEMSTLNGTDVYDTAIYEVTLVTVNSKKVSVEAILLPRLTGPVSPLMIEVVSRIFPDFDTVRLQRLSADVDLILGGDYFGLHPKHELASDGENLRIMLGELGVCVQGSHQQQTGMGE